MRFTTSKTEVFSLHWGRRAGTEEAFLCRRKPAPRGMSVWGEGVLGNRDVVIDTKNIAFRVFVPSTALHGLGAVPVLMKGEESRVPRF